MKELDALLSAYLETRYDKAGDAEKAAFEALLALPDPDLVGYLLQRQSPESEDIAAVVAHILGRTSS
jgi:succinate dehydrogenase flavin-adding protein (antitoxin of CptAB toxin-antitoxin module)